ncbi:MAG: N-acetylmuramoyl-L-alanine amidase [Syntrophobacteraceae bacterium]
MLLPALLSGCGKQYVASDPGIPPQSSTLQTQAPRAKSRGPAEVVERSVGFLGAPRNLVHEVGPLETIWRIARMYDVTPDSIYRANGIRPNDQLKVGQKLSIPNARMIRHVINLYPNTKWQYIVVHHTATGKGNAKTINRSHGDRGFWNGLGYHFLIDNGTLGKGDGQIEMSPRWIRQQVGAHCKASGMNDMAIGISLVGNFNVETPTPNQLQSLSLLLTTLRNYYRIPSTKTFGHREVPGAKTECPGSLFPISAIRSRN